MPEVSETESPVTKLRRNFELAIGSSSPSRVNENSIERQKEVEEEFHEMMLTHQEIMNLRQLRAFKQYRWWITVKRLKRGDAFGNEVFENQKKEQDFIIRKETMQAVEKTGLAILTKQNYLKILRKAMAKDRVDKL